MHSDDTTSRQRAFQTPSCHLCLRPQNDPNGVAHRTAVLPFPKDLGIADYRPGSSPCQVHAEETHHPFYSWGDVRPARWDWPLDSPHAPCTCVREIRRDCGCIQRWYYPEHPFNGCRVPPHLKVRGQRYYREVLYVSEQHYRGPEQGDADQDDSSAPSNNGHCQRRRVCFQNHEEQHGFNGVNKSRCNGTDSGPAAFFPTEVPPGILGRSRARGSANELARDIRTSQGSECSESHGNRGKSQGTVREQIKQVVTELEEVLGGLKQVQLEMKEVVQQIDILTSNIDLNEYSGFLQDERHRSGRTATVASSDQESPPKSSSETSDSSITHRSVSVDSFLTNNPSAMRNHTSSSHQRPFTAENNFNAVVQQTHRTGSTVNGTCLPHRTSKIRANGEPENHRPPPYPQNGQVKTRTAPCSGKHKTLSSTIV